MADLSDMKPTELTTLWCDLSRPITFGQIRVLMNGDHAKISWICY